MNVEITALAEANLEEIYLRIRKDSPGRAVEWREGLRSIEGRSDFGTISPAMPSRPREWRRA